MHRGDNNAHRMDRLLFHFRSHETTIPDIKLEDILSKHDDIDIVDANALVDVLNKTGPNIRFHPFFRHSDNDERPSPSGMDRLERVSFKFEETPTKTDTNSDDTATDHTNTSTDKGKKIVSLTIGCKNTSSVVVPLDIRRFEMLETLVIFDYKSIESQPQLASSNDDDNNNGNGNGNGNGTNGNNRSSTSTSPQLLQFDNIKYLSITRCDAIPRRTIENGVVNTSSSHAATSTEPHMLEMFPNLKILAIRQCSGEIDNILKYDLSESRCRDFHHPTNYFNSLTHFKLDYCNMRNSMTSLINCTLRQNLAHLGLSYCYLTEEHLEVFIFDVLHHFPNLVTANFEGNHVKTMRFVGKRLRRKKAMDEPQVEYSSKFRRLILKRNPFSIRSMLSPSSRAFLSLLRVYKGLSDFGLTDLSPEVDRLRRTNHVEKVFTTVPIGYMPIVLQKTRNKSDIYAFVRYSPLLQLLLLRNETGKEDGLITNNDNDNQERHKTAIDSNENENE